MLKFRPNLLCMPRNLLAALRMGGRAGIWSSRAQHRVCNVGEECRFQLCDNHLRLHLSKWDSVQSITTCDCNDGRKTGLLFFKDSGVSIDVGGGEGKKLLTPASTSHMLTCCEFRLLWCCVMSTSTCWSKGFKYIFSNIWTTCQLGF